MTNELDGSVLFELEIKPNIKFNIQRETIITWRDSRDFLNEDNIFYVDDIDLAENDNRALSFQELEGVNEVKKTLDEIQKKISNYFGTNVLSYSDYNKGEEEEELEKATIFKTHNYLPEVSVENLPFITKIIQIALDSNTVKKINDEVMHDDVLFIRKLGEIFKKEEENANENPLNNFNSMNNLAYIFLIVKNLFLIASKELIEKLVSDEFYLLTFGALEYDQESQQKLNHRHFLKEIANFKNILNIKDINLLNIIHTNHRLLYLRDTAIGRFIQELPFVNINVILQSNNMRIVQYFFDNSKILKDLLIDSMKEIDEALLVDKINFLLELINCTKDFIQKRTSFHELLFSIGFIEFSEKMLLKEYKNEKIKSNIIEILVDLISFAPTLFKDYITEKFKAPVENENKEENKSDSNILLILYEILVNYSDFGIKYEIGNIVKTLLDSSDFVTKMFMAYSEKSEEKLNNTSEFQEIIFDKFLFKLAHYLPTKIDKNDEKLKSSQVATKQIIIDILCYCLLQKCGKIQYWLIHNDIFVNVIKVFDDNVKTLDLSIIKFTKSIIAYNDYNFNKMLISTNYFDKIFELFEKNKKKENLLFSSIKELFLILKNYSKSKKLICYILENYKNIIYNEDNKPYFIDLINHFENLNDSEMNLFSNHGMSSYRKESEDIDRNEESEEMLGNSLIYLTDNLRYNLRDTTENFSVVFSDLNSNNNLLGIKRKSEDSLEDLMANYQNEKEEEEKKSENNSCSKSNSNKSDNQEDEN